MGNSFGKLFKLTSFGESHGKVIGGVIDGCPSNIEIDFDYIQSKLDRRKPGQSDITTDREEEPNKVYEEEDMAMFDTGKGYEIDVTGL